MQTARGRRRRYGYPGLLAQWPHLREALIEMAMIALVVGETGLGQISARRNEAVDRPLRPLMPADVEGGELGEELKIAVRQMVVDPPGHGLPSHPLVKTVDQPGDDEAGHRADPPIRATPIPDMASSI